MSIQLERLLSLRSIPPFDTLQEGELAALARVCAERQWAPGQQVLGGARVPASLYIVVEGWLESEGVRLGSVLGEPGLLFGFQIATPWAAGAEGARALLLTRGHFFTLLNECPWILEPLLDRLDREGELREFGTAASRGEGA